jgi:hypothetical protein
VILDHAGCILKHGLPCQSRDWSLLGQVKGKRKKKDEEPDVNVQQCGSCYAVFLPGPDKCPYCGAVIEKKVRKITESDGELEKIDLSLVRKQQRKEQGSARTLRDLVALGMRRGMAKASQWSAITLAARENRKPTPADFNEARRIYEELKR